MSDIPVDRARQTETDRKSTTHRSMLSDIPEDRDRQTDRDRQEDYDSQVSVERHSRRAAAVAGRAGVRGAVAAVVGLAQERDKHATGVSVAAVDPRAHSPPRSS